eukprot:4190716-Pyramimonas_sp.AAC.1
MGQLPTLGHVIEGAPGRLASAAHSPRRRAFLTGASARGQDQSAHGTGAKLSWDGMGPSVQGAAM